jgi:hypothetical protein
MLRSTTLPRSPSPPLLGSMISMSSPMRKGTNTSNKTVHTRLLSTLDKATKPPATIAAAVMTPAHILVTSTPACCRLARSTATTKTPRRKPSKGTNIGSARRWVCTSRWRLWRIRRYSTAPNAMITRILRPTSPCWMSCIENMVIVWNTHIFRLGRSMSPWHCHRAMMLRRQQQHMMPIRR